MFHEISQNLGLVRSRSSAISEHFQAWMTDSPEPPTTFQGSPGDARIPCAVAGVYQFKSV